MSEDNDEKKIEGTVELNLDDLEGASGGYIVDRGSYGSNGRKPYAVVNDETGKFWTDTWSLQGAIDCAGAKGISTKVISQEEYDGLFGTNGTLKY